MKDKEKTQGQLIKELTQLRQRITELETAETERKQAEEALRESEARYRLHFENVSDVIYSIDPEFRVLDVSPSVERVLGYKPEELIGRSFQELNVLAPAYLEQTFSDAMRILGGERITSAVYQFIARDGTKKWGEVSGAPLVRDGQVVALISVARDITERKQAEEALRESEGRFRTLAESSPVGIFLDDAQGNAIYVNDRCAELVGLSPKECLGFSWVPSIHPDDRERVIREWAKAVEQGTTFHQEYRWVHGDGSVVSTIGLVAPVRGEGGEVILFVGKLIDITERKQAEEALRESEARYRELADSIADVFFAMDENLRYTYWNRASEKLTGIPAKDAIGKSLYDLFPDTPQTRNAEGIYRDVLRAKQPRTFVNEYQLGGKDLLFEISAYPSKHGLSVFVKDITERKRAEEELQRSYDQLRETLISAVNALASTVEMKDHYTAGHQSRVTRLACAIAEEMGLSEEQIEGIRMAGLLHDIGKISIPAEILNKPGQLTELQFSIIKTHPQIGYDILKEIEFPWPVTQIVLQHHERLNGSGYPQGLSGEEIILEAKILAVADVVEAMVSHRPYRPALGIDKALDEISRNRGIRYYPEAADACIKLFTEKRFMYE